MGQTVEGTGTNPNQLQVNKAGEALTFSTIVTTEQAAVIREDNFSVNSGIITLDDDTEQGILFIKNNESRDLAISTLRVSLGPTTNGDPTDTTEIRAFKNPTLGTLITEELEAEVKSNSKFSSNIPVKIDSFKGTGTLATSTVTDGSVHGIVLVSPGTTQPFIIDELLANGESFAITYKAPDSNTNMKCVASATVFLTNPLAGV